MAVKPLDDVTVGLRDTLMTADTGLVFDIAQHQYSGIAQGEPPMPQSDGDLSVVTSLDSGLFYYSGADSPTSEVVASTFQFDMSGGHSTDASGGEVQYYGAAAAASGFLVNVTPGDLTLEGTDGLNSSLSARTSNEAQTQYSDSSSDNADVVASKEPWSNDQLHAFHFLGSTADAAGSEFHFSAFSGEAADAKGGPGGGGSHGGGGGGGGSGLLTTYISGDSNVDDANEFNIQIDFSGKWTAAQQAIVTWAADTLEPHHYRRYQG